MLDLSGKESHFGNIGLLSKPTSRCEWENDPCTSNTMYIVYVVPYGRSMLGVARWSYYKLPFFFFSHLPQSSILLSFHFLFNFWTSMFALSDISGIWFGPFKGGYVFSTLDPARQSCRLDGEDVERQGFHSTRKPAITRFLVIEELVSIYPLIYTCRIFL